MIGYTTIQQSRRLLNLGLNIDSADMYYYDWRRMTDLIGLPHNGKGGEKDLPCWSLNALLEVMPGSISKYDNYAHATKSYGLNLFRSHYHCCGYSFGPSLNKENHDNLCCFGAKTWVDAVFKCLVWLLENGYDKGE